MYHFKELFFTVLRTVRLIILPVEIPPYELMQIFLPVIRLMQSRMIFQPVIPIPLQRPFADIQQQANILIIVQSFPVQVILRLLVPLIQCANHLFHLFEKPFHIGFECIFIQWYHKPNCFKFPII